MPEVLNRIESNAKTKYWLIFEQAGIKPLLNKHAIVSF